jgi:hypothetical protein
VPGGLWSVGCGDGGVSLGAGSGVGAGVAGAADSGVCCCPFCVCDVATPAQQLSNMRDELLRSSKRLLRLDIFDPTSFSSENDPPLCSLLAVSVAKIAPMPTRSADGRRSRREVRGGRSRKSKLQSRIGAPSRKDDRQRQRRRLGRHQRASKMNECADRAIIVRKVGGTVACGSAGCPARCLDPCRRLPAHAIEMHMPETECELESERKERNARTQSQARSKPTHGR